MQWRFLNLALNERSLYCVEMPDIQRTVFGLLLLVPQFWSVILSERWASVSTIPMTTPPHLQDWNYPYPNTNNCTFPYIWQPSVGRCCYPVFNCESGGTTNGSPSFYGFQALKCGSCGYNQDNHLTHLNQHSLCFARFTSEFDGSGIEFCSVNEGKDLCVKCKNSFKQYHLVHSFDGINATCFNVSENECTVETGGEAIPARDNFFHSCGLRCECDSSSCYYGYDPCRCRESHWKCKSNQQMNRLTGVCEACPWYGYKLKEDCDACLVNESLWMSGTPTPNITVPPTPNVTVPPTPNVTVPPTPSVTVPRTPNVTVLVTTVEGNLTKIITEETINKTTTALLPEIANDTTIRWVMIIGGVVGFFIAGMALMYLFQKRTSKRSRASSSQYSSISQVPPIAVANQGPTTEYQEESETSDLMNNISETNIQQSNGLIRGQSVSNNNNHLVNHRVEDHIDSHKSSESGNHLGIHEHINERNQSVSSNNESPENFTEPREGTHQIDDSDHTRQFNSCPPVEKGQSWRFPIDSVADNDSLTVAKTLSGYENVAQNTDPQAICTRDVVKRANDNTSIILVKEFIKLHPLNSRGTRGPDLKTPNHEGGICCEDSKIPNEEPRVPSEESPHASPQYLTMPCSPTSASNRSTFRPFVNRSISSPTDRPTAKVPPMRQEPQNQRQDGVTSTDTSMSFSVIRIPGALLSSDESLESSIPSLNSCCEDNPPSYSYITNSPNTASHTVGGTEPKRPGNLRSATKNGSQIQKMVNQSQGGPDGSSLPSEYQENRVREPWHEVFETEVKVPVQSEETDPKTLLSSTQVRDRIKVEITDSDSEDDPEKIVLKVILAEDTEKQIKNSYEDFAYPDLPLIVAENNSDEVQGKTLRNNFFAIGANASNKEIDLRNVSLHNGNQIVDNKWAFLSELEHEENKLNSAAKSKIDTEETSHSYCSFQDKENVKKETKSLDNGGNDDGFRDSKSSLEEIEKDTDDFDTDPDVEDSSSDQRSSHCDDEGVCSNGDAELNRELQQPSQGQIDVHNEFNSSSLSVNSDESGIDIEEQNIQNLQGC